jgi:hypothetical protein
MRIRNWLGHAAVGAAVHSRAALVSDATGRRCLAGTSLRSTPARLIDARGGLHFNCFAMRPARVVDSDLIARQVALSLPF